MARSASKVATSLDGTAEAVLGAFQSARDAGRPSVECYLAGVAEWRRACPDQTPEYAAKRAVAIILAKHAKIRTDLNK